MTRKPWVGAEYAGLLIVGESFYGIAPADDTPDLATRIIGKVVERDLATTFHTRVARVVTGQFGGAVDAPAFWNGVAFWNFVQRAMADPREQPTRQDFQAGHDAFGRLLRTLQPAPRHVLVLGQRIFKEMPPLEGPTLPGIEGGDRNGWPGCWRTGAGGYAVAMAINHPSRAWSLQGWHPVVRSFLALSPPPLER